MAYPCSGPRRAKTVSTRSGKDPCSVSGRVGIHSSLSKRAHYASMHPSKSTEAKFFEITPVVAKGLSFQLGFGIRGSRFGIQKGGEVRHPTYQRCPKRHASDLPGNRHEADVVDAGPKRSLIVGTGDSDAHGLTRPAGKIERNRRRRLASRIAG